MKPHLILLALLASPLAFGNSLSYVTNTGSYSTGTTCEASTAITPAAGDDLVEIVETFTTGATFSSVASTISAAVTTDETFTVNGTNNIGYGVYRVHNASATSQNLIVTFGSATNCYAWLYDIRNSGSGGATFDQPGTVANGTVSPFTTGNIAPAQNGALLIGVAGLQTSKTLSAWTNSFTAGAGIRTAGPTAYSAYLAQTTAASVNAGATISASGAWSGLLFDYVPNSVSCTHSGITSAGAVAIPNGSTGSYWLKNGSFGTPDCATVNYWQPALGNFGTS